jgi:hypothetical protein
MNIDFHYGYVYVAARLADMPRADAEVVAHACQYIDDSTVDGILDFRQGQSYERFAAAHSMIDYRNMVSSKDRVVWAPFHFIPGGSGETLEEKAVCQKNSPIAIEMMRSTLELCRDRDNALHRLGVALHVYMDTWAHHGFSGVLSRMNVVHKLHSDDHAEGTWESKLKATLGEIFEDVGIDFIDLVSKLGHGAALHFPDLPWAKWRYVNGLGQEIKRVNLPDFVDAADAACKVVRAFLKQTSDFENLPGLGADARNAIAKLMDANRSEDANERLRVVMDAVRDGRISGLAEDLPPYVPKGKGSWKFIATGIESATDDGIGKPLWSEAFENSDYRKFHDAVKEHRSHVMQEILPQHGIRLA